MDTIYWLLGPGMLLYFAGIATGVSLHGHSHVDNPFEIAGGDER
ncbi:hypothetical protein [Williamsia deligens]|uniref:Uncharacterized protein n=1 Tax=Williamsia deligens TaxID=321325 RepID=A0ABW3GC67_9NOCA|nr:hypothetical protein [Williamsia deligens]MCP2196330.1 hypothetical protein [Williamsia deligens]